MLVILFDCLWYTKKKKKEVKVETAFRLNTIVDT